MKCPPVIVFFSCLRLVSGLAQPEQIHLSFSSSFGIVITWSTKEPASTVVAFGKELKNDSWTTTTGSQTKFVDGGPEKRVQYMHKVQLDGLSEKTKYYYRCGGEGEWSKVFSFKTVEKAASWSPRFAVFGDLGLQNAKSLKDLAEETQRGDYDAILHVGDFAYDMDTDNGKVGDAFMNQIQKVAAFVPYMTCPGNHEHKYNFSNYKARFNMPGSKDAMFYSFDIGPAHIISFSTEFYYYVWFGIKQVWVQYHWLKRDLEEAAKPSNRAKRPWIIVMGHRPMYCSNNDKDDCTHFNRDLVRVGYPIVHLWGLEKMFAKYGVDVEIYAHEHSYERLWPIFDKRVYNGSKSPYTDPKAPVHIITGSAGCSEGHDHFVKNPPTWSAFRSADYGYGRMTIHNATHLSFQQVSIDKGGEIVDKFVIVKTSHGKYDHLDTDTIDDSDVDLKKQRLETNKSCF